jgi:hypothetical protein
MLGKLGTEGRGAPGVPTDEVTCAEGLGASPMPAGSGCLGPDKIWPGLGGGTGLAGIDDPLAKGFDRGLD